MGQGVKNSSVPPSLPKQTAKSCPKIQGTTSKADVCFDTQRNTGACSTDSSWFWYLGNSKGVPCQALHRAGNGSPSSRAFYPRLCVPGALLRFPLVVLNQIFLFTECWAHPKAEAPCVTLRGSGKAQLNFSSGARGCFPCSGILSSCSMSSGSLRHNTFWFLCLSLQILNRAPPQAWKGGLR